jgi:Tol biopolymer transport system component
MRRCSSIPPTIAPLLEHPAPDASPFWTPDGKRILFRSNRSGSRGFWLLDVEQGRAKGAPTLINEALYSHRMMGFTQDGSFYYATKNLNKDVYVATLDLEAGAVLSPPAKISLRFEGSNRAPVWSPDGKRLAYFSRRGPANPEVLVVRSLDTGQERDISLQSDFRPYLYLVFSLPQWSRDGRSISVGGRTKAGPGRFLIDVETGGVTALLQRKPGDEGYRAWSVFSRDDKTVYNVRGLRLDRLSTIVAHDLESGKEVEIYRAALSVGKLALSPDGRQLAFCEGEKKDKFVLKTMPISGGEPRELLTIPKYKSLERELGLSWTSDGNHLVVAHPGNNTDLWVIPVDGGETRTVKLGAKARGMRLHPDGKRIAFTIGPLYESGEVWALENFLPKDKTSK